MREHARTIRAWRRNKTRAKVECPTPSVQPRTVPDSSAGKTLPRRTREERAGGERAKHEARQDMRAAGAYAAA